MAEAGLQADPLLGRTCGLQGHPPVGPTAGQRQRLNGIGAVKARGEFWAATYAGKLEAERCVALLTAFRQRPTETICLVVDELAVPKSKVGAQALATGKGRWALPPQPPDCPDLKPNAFVWSHRQNHGVSKQPLQQNDSWRKRGGGRKTCGTYTETGSLGGPFWGPGQTHQTFHQVCHFGACTFGGTV